MPAPQGSKVRTKWGLREDNPATRPWREAVAWEARAAMAGRPCLTCGVVVHLSFWFPRPKGHYGTGRNSATLRPSAPTHHTVKPDIDKLTRAALDGMSHIVFRDDSQVRGLMAYKGYSETPCMWVQVFPDSATSAAGPSSAPSP